MAKFLMDTDQPHHNNTNGNQSKFSSLPEETNYAVKPHEAI